jgi:hypothetical protein
MKPQPDENGSNGGKITGIRSSSLGCGFEANYFGDNPKHVGQCPFGKPADRLYVRESAWIYGQWIKNGFTPKGRKRWKFKVIGQQVSFEKPGLENIAYFGTGPGYTFRPSIHMPRWASRITLEIVSVRVERMNQISEADARAEGVAPLFSHYDIYERNGYRAELDLNPMPWTNYLWHGQKGLSKKQVEAHPYQFSSYALAQDSFSSLWQSVYGPGSFDDRWVWVVEFKRL